MFPTVSASVQIVQALAAMDCAILTTQLLKARLSAFGWTHGLWKTNSHKVRIVLQCEVWSYIPREKILRLWVRAQVWADFWTLISCASESLVQISRGTTCLTIFTQIRYQGGGFTGDPTSPTCDNVWILHLEMLYHRWKFQIDMHCEARTKQEGRYFNRRKLCIL